MESARREKAEAAIADLKEHHKKEIDQLNREYLAVRRKHDEHLKALEVAINDAHAQTDCIAGELQKIKRDALALTGNILNLPNVVLKSYGQQNYMAIRKLFQDCGGEVESLPQPDKSA